MTPEKKHQADDKLWNSSFVAVSLILLLNFCNMAVFFQFDAYLKTLGINQSNIGLIIGLFSLAALVVRPFVSPFLQPVNARRWIFWGMVGTVTCLFFYNLAHTFAALAVLRLLHGGCYVVMSCAAMAALTGSIPPSRSGQAFGVIGVVVLAPFALAPPLLPAMERLLGGYLAVLTITALPVIGVVFLLPLIRADQTQRSAGYSFNRKELAANLKDPVILALMGASFLMYCTFSFLFYYVHDFAKALAIAAPGLFFTLATGSEIATRLGLGPFLDKRSKRRAAVISLGVLAAGYLALPYAAGAGFFFPMAVLFGLGWGVSVPAVSAMIFDRSEPRFRALNTNLGFEMLQGGYFIGPFLGGVVVQAFGYGAMFTICAGFLLLALCLAAMARDQKGTPGGRKPVILPLDHEI